MLEKLYGQIENTGATIKIGAVQFRGEVTELPLTPLTENTKDVVTEFMSARPETGGSNMHAGLTALKKCWRRILLSQTTVNMSFW